MTDTMLDKVRKLLAKAEDPGCTPAEAAALNDKAAELIAKYGVDRALLAASTPGVDPVGDRTISIYPPYALDKASLLGVVAHALRCRSVRIKQRTSVGNTYGMHLFGCQSDLERTELLYTSLLVQAYRGDRVIRRMSEAYPRLGTAPPRRLMGSGAGHGYAAGQKADLGGVGLGRATAGRLGAH
jgi:hypothetical protein